MKTGWFLRFQLARSTVSFLGHPMCAQGIVKTWLKTNVGNLVKHRSGGYYARLYVGGKERWTSLRTKVLEVAKARFREQHKSDGSSGRPPTAKPGNSIYRGAPGIDPAR